MSKADWFGVIALGIGFGGLGLPFWQAVWVLCILSGLLILLLNNRFKKGKQQNET